MTRKNKSKNMQSKNGGASAPSNGNRVNNNNNSKQHSSNSSGSLKSAGVSYSLAMPSSFIKRIGGPQKIADFDTSGGCERVSFADQFTLPIKAGSTTAAAGFGSTALYYKDLTPSSVSPRLAQYEQLYQYYAFRKLRIIYQPLSGSTTAVGMNIGLINGTTNNADDLIPSPTATTVMELRPAMQGLVWSTNEMSYEHNGARLFDTDAAKSAEELVTQAALVCVLDGTPVAGTTYGKLHISGIIDFYKDVPVPTSPAPSFYLGKLLKSEECKREVVAREVIRLLECYLLHPKVSSLRTLLHLADDKTDTASSYNDWLKVRPLPVLSK